MSANENMGYGKDGGKNKIKTHSKSFVTWDFLFSVILLFFVFLECHNYCINIQNEENVFILN